MFPQTSIISFRALSKSFSESQVLKNVNCDIVPGEIFGLLGVNGAGKTTLIRCLMGLLKPQSGEIFFEGRALTHQAIQDNLGFLPENFSLPGLLTAREFLALMGKGIGKKSRDVGELLAQVNLGDTGAKRIKYFSRGMLQRLGVACALLKNAAVLVLDEPTLGLDPLGQKQMINLMRELNRQGKTIFFSSHILSQIEKICTRVGILHGGRIALSGTVREVMDSCKASSLDEAFLKIVEA